jgi:hypothetical protein
MVPGTYFAAEVLLLSQWKSPSSDSVPRQHVVKGIQLGSIDEYRPKLLMEQPQKELAIICYTFLAIFEWSIYGTLLVSHYLLEINLLEPTKDDCKGKRS